jgi:CBS domain-containing protein
MKVEQIMTKDVGTCCPEETLNEAARIMWERDCGFVPVVDGAEQRRVVGVVTDRDVCMATYTRGQAPTQVCVGEVMSRGVRTCRTGDDLKTAESVMREAKVHRLPVVDDADQLLGVISLADIAREAARQAGAKRKQVTTAEIGEAVADIRAPRRIAGTRD